MIMPIETWNLFIDFLEKLYVWLDVCIFTIILATCFVCFFQAKKFVESLPQVVKADIAKDEAEKLKEALVAVGAEVEID